MKKILFVNPFGLGDVIFTMASVQRVREVYPEAFVGFVCNERVSDLLALCPAVNRVYVFDRGRLRDLWKKSPMESARLLKSLLNEIASEKYETLVDFSLGREFSLAGMMVGIRQRLGLDYKGRGIFLTRKKKIRSYEKLPVAQEQITFLHEAGILPDDRMPEAITINVSAASEISGDVLAVAPGGGRSWGKDAIYKQWDPEKFAAAVNRTVARKPGIHVVLLGDEPEQPLLESVKSKINGADITVMAGQPIAKVCAALKGAKLLLCNDGGLAHLANALGTKTITLFGPVDETVYGPYGGQAAKRLIVHPVPCRPCYNHFHFPPCTHNRQCLAGLSSDKVVEAIREIL